MPHVLSNMSIIVRRRIYEYCHIMYVYHVSYAYLLIFKNYQIFMFLPIWNFFLQGVYAFNISIVGYVMLFLRLCNYSNFSQGKMKIIEFEFRIKHIVIEWNCCNWTNRMIQTDIWNNRTTKTNYIHILIQKSS